jgi:hypothetical protein
MRPSRFSARFQRIALAALVLFAPSLVRAATYIVPPDADLIREADAIAIVTVQSSHCRVTAEGSIDTDYEAVVERPLKAAPAAGSSIVITQRGGTIGELALAVSGEPVFLPGERALVMMRRLGVHRFTTLSSELGKFNFVRDAQSRQLLVRGATEGEINGWDVAGQRHAERSREATAFLRYIGAIVAGETPVADYEVEERVSPLRPVETDSHVPGNDYFTRFTISSVSQGARWPGGSLPMMTVGTQTGVANLAASINTSRGAWNGDPNSSIGISNLGTGTGTYGTNDGVNLIFFDQPSSGPLAGSVVGQANLWATSTQNSNGSDTYFTSIDCDIVIEAGFTGALFEAILAHEMGHCIGYRHSNQPGPGQTTSATNALMNSSAPSGATLRAWDSDAASHGYGSGTTSCVPPSIATQPASKSIASGTTTSLSVLAGGTSPFTYQWYIGNSGDTSMPTGSNSATLSNLSPTSTTSYWVRVTGQCPSPVDSNTATITVQPCVPASITTQPLSKTITAGSGTSLSVVAGGTSPFTYQWYIGNAGDTSTPTGSNLSTLNGLSPSATTSYWVRVTGQCAPAVDSDTATITVTPCATVVFQSVHATSGTGGQATLTANAFGGSGISYTWFRGDTPGAGGTQIGFGTPLVVTVTQTTNFWVRARNSCGNSTVSDLVTASPCVLPEILTQPPDATINSGGTANLAIVLGGSGNTVNWYAGVPLSKATPVGTGESVTVGPLNATSTFWAAVGNTCGEIPSRTVTVTVLSCTPPSITTQPSSSGVKGGQTVTLSVVATGTATLSYQWFSGQSGETGTPVGTNSSVFTSGALLKDAKFWVRVTNGCGTKDSATVPVSVSPTKRHAVRSR